MMVIDSSIGVSIIIPIYNVEPYIERCINSVIAQTYKNIEIILIDDKGNDKSIEIAQNILDEYSEKFKVKIISHEFNKGLSVARNTGIRAAECEYIYFLDSDDCISTDCIELLMYAALKIDADFVIGDYECRGNTRLQMPLLKLKTTYLASNEEVLLSYKKGEWYSMAVNKLIKKEFVELNNLYFQENIIHEDELWSFLLACKANKVGIVHEKTYFYYLRSDSITGLLESKQDEKKKLHSKKSNEAKMQIIRIMYEFIIEGYLYKNKNICLAYEIKKDTLFYTILKTNFYSHEEFFVLYKSLREMKCPNLIKHMITNKLTLKDRLKLLHYLLPKSLGFRFYVFLANHRL